MKHNDVLIGLDIGTTSVKGMAITASGRMLSKAQQGYPLLHPKPGWAEQSPDIWWKAAKKVLRILSQNLKTPAQNICAIGLTGQMHGLVMMDRNHRVIRNAILWCDQRTAHECRELESRIDPKIISKHILNPCLTGFTAGKILWVKNHEPKNFEHLHHILLPKDYIRFKLTGEFATDPSDASGTFLYDIANRQWCSESIDCVGISKSMLPSVISSTEISGVLTNSVARSLGLKKGIPVIAGAGDQAAGAIGSGIIKKGLASASLGTSGVLFSYLDSPIADPLMRTHTFCHAYPKSWHIMSVMLAAGASMKWMRDILKTKHKSLTYDRMTLLAQKSPPGAHGCLFLPYLMGERTPYPDPKARGAFAGLTITHKTHDLIRAVMEGITFGLKDGLEIIKQLHVPVNQIRAIGGGAKSDVWCQMQADIFTLPVYTLVIDEGPSLGAALLAGTGSKIYNHLNEACASTIKIKRTFKPHKKDSDHYQDIYRIYRSLYPALKTLSHKITEASQ